MSNNVSSWCINKHHSFIRPLPFRSQSIHVNNPTRTSNQIIIHPVSLPLPVSPFIRSIKHPNSHSRYNDEGSDISSALNKAIKTLIFAPHEAGVRAHFPFSVTRKAKVSLYPQSESRERANLYESWHDGDQEIKVTTRRAITNRSKTPRTFSFSIIRDNFSR